MFGLPVITTFGTPPAGDEVVGTDPWDDEDDATYARGSARPGGLTHILTPFDPAVVDGDGLVVTIRLSATVSSVGALARFVANLYPPGATMADISRSDYDPALNLQFGDNPVYVTVPTPDGEIYDLETTVYDWNTEEPATAEQIETYFAGGGTLDVLPNVTGVGTTAVITIHRIGFLAAPVEAETYRRIFPRDDGFAGGAPRNYPPSKSVQAGIRTSGGYL